MNTPSSAFCAGVNSSAAAKPPKANTNARPEQSAYLSFILDLPSGAPLAPIKSQRKPWPAPRGGFMARRQDIGKTSSFNNVNLMTAGNPAPAPADGSSSQDGLRSMADLRGSGGAPAGSVDSASPGRANVPRDMGRKKWGRDFSATSRRSNMKGRPAKIRLRIVIGTQRASCSARPWRTICVLPSATGTILPGPGPTCSARRPSSGPGSPRLWRRRG